MPTGSSNFLRKDETPCTFSYGDSDCIKERSYSSSLFEIKSIITPDSVSESMSANTVLSSESSPLSVMGPDIMKSLQKIETRESIVHADGDTAMIPNLLSSSDVSGAMDDDNFVAPLRGWNNVSRIERSEPFSRSSFPLALQVQDATNIEVTRTSSHRKRVLNGDSDFENTQQKSLVNDPVSIDVGKAGNAALNQNQSASPLFVSSRSSSTSSGLTFYRGLHLWPKDGRDVIPEIDVETMDVNVKQMSNEFERKTGLSRPESVDVEKQSTAVNQTQSSPSIPSSNSSNFPFYSELNSRPKNDSDGTTENDMETTIVDLKQMINQLEKKIKFYNSKNGGRISFDAISPKMSRSVLFREKSYRDKDTGLDVNIQEKRTRGRPSESETTFSDAKDILGHEVKRSGSNKDMDSSISFSSTERPALVSPSIHWHDKKRNHNSI